MRILLALAMAVLAVAGCTTKAEQMAEAGKTPLSKEEVMLLVANTTERGVASTGADYVIYWDPSGEMRGEATWSGGSEIDRGTWSVGEDGLFCRQWENWVDGRQGCWRLYEDGDEIVWALVSGSGESSQQSRDEILTGNVENL